MQTKGRWFSVHRWLGIVLGLWFALVGLTGAILVYEEPLDAWLNPHLLRSASRGAVLPPERESLPHRDCEPPLAHREPPLARQNV